MAANMVRATAFILALIVAPSALAQLPASCTTANKLRDDYIRRAGSSGLSASAVADTLFGTGNSDTATMAAQREATFEAKLQTVARMCIGDLVADKRYEDAASEALRFGMAKDAEALYRQIAAFRAQEKSSP
jgi:hypothetical protein